MVQERPRRNPRALAAGSRRARAPLPRAVAGGDDRDPRASSDEPRRLLPAHRRSRLAHALPVVLRTARRRDVPGRMETAAGVVDQLLVARSRGVARKPRHDPASRTIDAIPTAVG